MSCHRTNGCTKLLATGETACLLCPHDGETLPAPVPVPIPILNSNPVPASGSDSDSDSDSGSGSEPENNTDVFGHSGAHLYSVRLEYTETIHYRTYVDIAADTEEEARSYADDFQDDGSFDSYDSDVSRMTVETCEEIA